MPADARPLSGVATIAAEFDLCLCDVWGVVHNGVVAHAEACAALVAMRRQGLSVVLVTNAPRPRAEILPQLRALGVPGEAFDAVVTSGDVARELIRRRAGEPVLRIGPERDLPLVAGLDLRETDAGRAGYVLCTGLYNDESDTIEDYAGQLALCARRGLVMICANPDLVVDRGGRLVLCAGSLAVAYERLGGEVIYAGKPHRPIYEMAVAEAAALRGAPVDPARICAVGDAIRTDIAGAHGFGVRSVMTLGGIHAEETLALDEAGLGAWLDAQTHRPTYVLPQLRW
jgi:HAD superfamily hydrolase (TIGR01459 family)